MILYMYIATGQGQTTPWGQNFDVNRNSLSLCPFVVNLKKLSLNSDFIHIFNDFIYVYSPGARQKTPWDKLLMSTKSPYHFDGFLCVFFPTCI